MEQITTEILKNTDKCWILACHWFLQKHRKNQTIVTENTERTKQFIWTTEPILSYQKSLASNKIHTEIDSVFWINHNVFILLSVFR